MDQAQVIAVVKARDLEEEENQPETRDKRYCELPVRIRVRQYQQRERGRCCVGGCEKPTMHLLSLDDRRGRACADISWTSVRGIQSTSYFIVKPRIPVPPTPGCRDCGLIFVKPESSGYLRRHRPHDKNGEHTEVLS
jgi:hypothetical protein